MPRAKFYPHEKTLHDLRLKQDDLPELIQNEIDLWKKNKLKTGYHKEYVEESEQIASLIQEWQAEPSLYEESEQFDSIGSNASITNDFEINEENEDLEQEQIDTEIEELEKQLNEDDKVESLPNHSDTELLLTTNEGVKVGILHDAPESEIQTGLFVPIPNQSNPFYNSLNKIEKLCYTLLKEVKENQIEQPVFSLEYLKSRGLNDGFWSNFSKLSGYEGKHFDMIRVSSTPLYFQIKQKS